MSIRFVTKMLIRDGNPYVPVSASQAHKERSTGAYVGFKMRVLFGAVAWREAVRVTRCAVNTTHVSCC